MIRTGSRGILAFIFKVLFIAFLLVGAFGIVWLRSNVIRLEYTLSELEKKRMEYLKERKILLAEKAGILSFEKVEASLSRNYSFILPDRVRVIHIKKESRSLPYKASLKEKN
jgi:hypothetical protein